MSRMTQNNNISTDAIDRLLTQFKDQANIEALIQVYTDEMQEIEDVLFELRDNRSLDTAEGDQLDVLGAIVGQDRGGRSDADYLNYIILKIAQNTSRGTAEDVFAIFNILTSSESCHLLELFPAAIEIYADHDISSLNTDDISNFTELALGAGIKLDNIGYYLEGEAFGFDGDVNALGFGDATDATLGGKFASLV